MRKIENQVILLAACAIIICFLLLLVGEIKFIQSFNKSLLPIYNIMAYLSMIFSAIAILIAAIAFKISSQKPELKLSINPWDAEEEGPALAIESENGLVTITRPLSSWGLTLVNNGKVSAKNPIVKIRFKGAYFGENSFDGWEACEHANGKGYFGYLWSPKQGESQVVHSGFPYYLPTMYFSEEYVEDNLSIEIFIAADETNTINYELPVKVSSI